jgi:hypothetical protein
MSNQTLFNTLLHFRFYVSVWSLTNAERTNFILFRKSERHWSETLPNGMQARGGKDISARVWSLTNAELTTLFVQNQNAAGLRRCLPPGRHAAPKGNRISICVDLCYL